MLSLIFLLLLNGCITTKKQLEWAKAQVIGQCIEEIEIKLMRSGCVHIEYIRGRDQFVFRCDKPDNMRINLWDTWWFRVTSSIKEWPDEVIEEVERHTICVDGRHRLEAYPPEKQ
tara:strand:- start:263 stop:607 length:345 start_codon:yes stop_codon:yes gene_type:complete